MDSTLTPCASPNRDKGEENQDYLCRLEKSLEKCGLFSLKSNEPPSDDISNRMDEMEENDASLKLPKINSHGKVKLYKCKQCDHVSSTQYDQWEHNRIHIKKDKMLSCPTCPFITEYKHHLEYHLLKHVGSKPFQCTKCEYSCINKSHMKSHSNVYRYSCNDCSYDTKYCLSLKTHLRRFGHKPNVILDEDGNPCPDIIIDVHGTKPVPRIKNSTQNGRISSTPGRVAFRPKPAQWKSVSGVSLLRWFSQPSTFPTVNRRTDSCPFQRIDSFNFRFYRTRSRSQYFRSEKTGMQLFRRSTKKSP
jgi:protein-arginine kinase activator protein McsA